MLLSIWVFCFYWSRKPCFFYWCKCNWI